MLNEIGYFGRLAAGYWRFARTPPAPDPKSLIAANLARREENFLELMEKAVFSRPQNPYHALFRHAGCSFGDLKNAIERRGLEGALADLRRSGVYLTHDEFKGKKAIERPGLRIEAHPGDFANPLVRGVLETTSSGSRSRGTVTRPSIEYQIYREAQDGLFVSQFNPAKCDRLTVLPILPSTLGFNRMLSFERRGIPLHAWFTLGGSWRDSGHYRLLTHLLVAETRLAGLRTMFPTYLPANDFSPVSRWIAERRARGRDVLCITPASMGVRTASAALAGGFDIRGTTFVCGAEPLTPARREVVEAAGCAVFSRYGISELGSVGCSCHEMDRHTRVHLMRDALAAISYTRALPMAATEVESLMFTTLLPFSMYALVNVEMDDCGELRPAQCSCEYKAMGFTEQISDVYSYGKLTGQGVTLLGGDLLSILERSLPARFGGSPVDYQLVELDGHEGVIVELRVNPIIGARSSDEIRDYFLTEVRRLWGGSLSARQWGQTGAVRVVFAEPHRSGGSKINPLHLLGPTGRAGPIA